MKVCGITRAADAVAAIEAGADLLGFNFYPRSPRYITPAAAAPIVALLPRQVLAVGIFVDAEPAAVADGDRRSRGSASCSSMATKAPTTAAASPCRR